jgi:hypothetical protein
LPKRWSSFQEICILQEESPFANIFYKHSASILMAFFSRIDTEIQSESDSVY